MSAVPIRATAYETNFPTGKLFWGSILTDSADANYLWLSSFSLIIH